MTAMVTGLSRFSQSVRVRSRWGPVGCLLDLVVFVTSFRSLRYVTGLSARCRASRGGFGVFVVDSVSCGRSGLCRFVLSIFLPYDTYLPACDGVRTCVAAGALVRRRCESLDHFPHLAGGRRRPTVAAGLPMTAGTSGQTGTQRSSRTSASQAGNGARSFERATLDVISAQCPSCRGEEIQPTAGNRRE